MISRGSVKTCPDFYEGPDRHAKQIAEATCSSLTSNVLETSSLSTRIRVCIIQANKLLLQLELQPGSTA